MDDKPESNSNEPETTFAESPNPTQAINPNETFFEFPNPGSEEKTDLEGIREGNFPTPKTPTETGEANVWKVDVPEPEGGENEEIIQSGIEPTKSTSSEKKGNDVWKVDWKLRVKKVVKVVFTNTITMVVVVLLILSGSFKALFAKMQNENVVKISSKTLPASAFSHPFVQSWIMGMGMSLSLPLLWTIRFFEKFKKKKSEDGLYESVNEKKPKYEVNKLYLFIPALFDNISAILVYEGLLLVFASVYMMLLSLLVIFTLVLSIFLLKSRVFLLWEKWAGSALIIVGSILVGLAPMIYYDEYNENASDPLLGCLFIIAAQIFQGVQYVAEEKLLKGYDVHVLAMSGYEGLWGVFIMTPILFVCYWIQGNNFGSVENFPVFLEQVFSSWQLFLCVISMGLCIWAFNLARCIVTKNLSAATLATIDTLRTGLIWLIQMLRGKQPFTWLQLVGFLFIVFGTFVYGQIFFNMTPFGRKYVKWSKKVMAKKKKKKKIDWDWERGESTKRKQEKQTKWGAVSFLDVSRRGRDDDLPSGLQIEEI